MRLLHLALLLILSGAILYLQTYALENYLYWKYWWMDVVMHSLGGILIGGVSLFISQDEFIPVFQKRPYFSVLFFALAVAISWEVFEWVYTIYDSDNYVADTVSDITFGVSFAVLTVLLLWRHKQES
jgi:hypothetical protein